MAEQETNQEPEQQSGGPSDAREDQRSLETQSNLASNIGAVVSDAADEANSSKSLPFYVVGLGASAGGVEAYIDLFTHLPGDTGMAYVVVLHLPADQKSHLREIIGRHTIMPVKDIQNEARIEPNHIYVVPPKRLVAVQRGVFRLEPPDGVKRPIDYFFYSLATDQKNRAIGIVLSGMDSDGALGMRAIKGEGGITMVQAPESARFQGMPRSTISNEHVDIISTPGAIAAQLAQLARQTQGAHLRLLSDGFPEEEHYFQRILASLRQVSGVDFRLYKPATLRRRMARRMLLHRIDTLGDYLSFLKSNPKELRDLQEDALISVTRFFRDPEVFDAFKNMVLPSLFDNREESQQVRLWIAGCSSGEEVYSFAICLLEYLGGTKSEPPIQIFGTDASETSIEKARLGNYSETISADVSAERLRRFFVKTEKGYSIAKRVRDLCIFARQNLCHDPPFSRMDVISCRNVLIYFKGELQEQLVRTFHYALRPGGYVFLGTSETIREFTDLFALIDRKHKIYIRAGGANSGIVGALPASMNTDLHVVQQSQAPSSLGSVDLQRAAERLLLVRYAPPGVVVNERMEILHAHGRLSPFLELRPGAASLELARMLRETIVAQVIRAVRHAIQSEIPVQVEGLQVQDGEQLSEATLEVLPIHATPEKPKSYLVVFTPARPKPPAEQLPAVEPGDGAVAESDGRVIAQLKHDLSSTKLYLQSLLEERDAKNQELLSANEEIQSANEELQSTNEELQTTKEELQSSNEELHTVNEELQNRNAILTQASNDLSNLLNSVNVPVLMLSNELTIRHFTPHCQRMMNLRASDIGRPFSELRTQLSIEDLTPVFTGVLETLAPRELEVQDHEGHWYLLRVRPYRTSDNKIDGLVMVLLDIDQLRRSQQELRTAQAFSTSIIQSVPLPLVVTDQELKIRATNEAFCVLTGLRLIDLDGRPLPALTSQLWSLNSHLQQELDKLRGSGETANQFEFEHAAPNSQVFCLRGSVLPSDHERFLLVTVEEITSYKKAENVLRKDKERLTTEVEETRSALERSQDELRALAASLFTSQEEERRRIARELHDDVSQRLAALEIDGDQVDRNIPENSAAAKEAIARIRSRIAQLADDVRVISHRLHPAIIEDLGLRAALRTLADDFGQRENMIVSFSSENVPDHIPLPTATALYRITQEALRNVGKHAGKTHTRVLLRGTRDGLQLQVADFGHGFDMESGRQGLGLVTMEERARQTGGSLEVRSALGEGTRVTVDVPIDGRSGTEKSLRDAT